MLLGPLICARVWWEILQWIRLRELRVHFFLTSVLASLLYQRKPLIRGGDLKAFDARAALAGCDALSFRTGQFLFYIGAIPSRHRARSNWFNSLCFPACFFLSSRWSWNWWFSFLPNRLTIPYNLYCLTYIPYRSRGYIPYRSSGDTFCISFLYNNFWTHLLTSFFNSFFDTCMRLFSLR